VNSLTKSQPTLNKTLNQSLAHDHGLFDSKLMKMWWGVIEHFQICAEN
jgi:hypothetical protein